MKHSTSKGKGGRRGKKGRKRNQIQPNQGLDGKTVLFLKANKFPELTVGKTEHFMDFLQDKEDAKTAKIFVTQGPTQILAKVDGENTILVRLSDGSIVVYGRRQARFNQIDEADLDLTPEQARFLSDGDIEGFKQTGRFLSSKKGKTPVAWPKLDNILAMPRDPTRMAFFTTTLKKGPVRVYYYEEVETLPARTKVMLINLDQHGKALETEQCIKSLLPSDRQMVSVERYTSPTHVKKLGLEWDKSNDKRMRMSIHCGLGVTIHLLNAWGSVLEDILGSKIVPAIQFLIELLEGSIPTQIDETTWKSLKMFLFLWERFTGTEGFVIISNGQKFKFRNDRMQVGTMIISGFFDKKDHESKEKETKLKELASLAGLKLGAPPKNLEDPAEFPADIGFLGKHRVGGAKKILLESGLFPVHKDSANTLEQMCDAIRQVAGLPTVSEEDSIKRRLGFD